MPSSREEGEFDSQNSNKTSPVRSGGKSEAEFKSVTQPPSAAYSFRKKVNLKLPKIEELVADEGLPSVTHKFGPGEAAFLSQKELFQPGKLSPKLKRLGSRPLVPIEVEDVPLTFKEGQFPEETVSLAAKEEYGSERKISDLRKWTMMLDEEEKRQIARDVAIVKEKLKNGHFKEKSTKTIEASAYHTYTLCCCCLKFGQTKNAYMCILINDVILSANLTLYGVISTYDLRYFITPLVFFVCSTITYIAWRVNLEQFSLINSLYYWARWVIFIVINVPFVLLLIKVFQTLSDVRQTSASYLSENLSPSEKVFLTILSLNNVYVLVVCATPTQS